MEIAEGMANLVDIPTNTRTSDQPEETSRPYAPEAPESKGRCTRKPALNRENVRPSGFEPETCGLRVRCSAVELEARPKV